MRGVEIQGRSTCLLRRERNYHVYYGWAQDKRYTVLHFHFVDVKKKIPIFEVIPIFEFQFLNFTKSSVV